MRYQLTVNSLMTIRSGVEFDPIAKCVKIIYGDEKMRKENIIPLEGEFLNDSYNRNRIMLKFLKELGKGRIPSAATGAKPRRISRHEREEDNDGEEPHRQRGLTQVSAPKQIGDVDWERKILNEASRQGLL